MRLGGGQGRRVGEGTQRPRLGAADLEVGRKG